MIRRPNKNQKAARESPSLGNVAEIANRLNKAAVLLTAVAEAARVSTSPPLVPEDIRDALHYAEEAAKALIEHTVQETKPITGQTGRETSDSHSERLQLEKLATFNASQLRSIIENEYTSEADISAETREARPLAHIKTILEKLSKATHVGVHEKLKAADALRTLAAEFEEASTPQIPKVAPKLWADRDDGEESPYVFAHREYGPAAQIMTMGQFKNLDPQLHSSFYKWASRKGKPSADLDIARERIRGGTLEQAIAWADILSDAPEHTKRKLRAYYAQRKRKLPRRTTNS